MSDDESRKIIVDEDWKSKVETEREQLKQEADEPATDGEAQPASSGAEGEIPPASFQFLVSSIATQVMFAMGQIPDPNTGQAMVDLELAKHHIDMLSVLDEKTKGNLSADESKMLTEALHQLRMAFVAVQEQLASQMAGQQPPTK